MHCGRLTHLTLTLPASACPLNRQMSHSWCLPQWYQLHLRILRRLGQFVLWRVPMFPGSCNCIGHVKRCFWLLSESYIQIHPVHAQTATRLHGPEHSSCGPRVTSLLKPKLGNFYCLHSSKFVSERGSLIIQEAMGTGDEHSSIAEAGAGSL